MNAIVRQEFGILHETQAMRNQIMDLLTDEDLAYRLPGANPTFGELCCEIGQVEQSYIDSFRTFKQDFVYPKVEAGLERSVKRLNAWFKTLDEALDAAISSLSEEDVQNKLIDRGYGMAFPARVQLHIYREALLIFYGKASVYLKAMNRPLPTQVQEWVG